MVFNLRASPVGRLARLAYMSQRSGLAIPGARCCMLITLSTSGQADLPVATSML